MYSRIQAQLFCSEIAIIYSQLIIIIRFCFSLYPNQAAISNVEVILRNAVKASTHSHPKPPFNVDSFSKSHNATPHSREWTATGYAPLRMPVDTDQMETANNNYTQQQIKYTKY